MWRAIFRKLYICDDGEVRAELAEPFDIILDKQLHQRALEAEAADEAPAETIVVPDWQLWENLRQRRNPDGLSAAWV